MEYSKRYPGIKILFIESNSLNLQEKLLSEEIEILIDYDFDEKVFETIPLKKEKILLAVPKVFEINDFFKENQLTAEDVHQDRHLESDVQSVDLSRFKDEKFIQLKAGNNMQKKGEKICKQYGFAPQSIIKVDQLMTAYNIAASGMGIAFTTDSVVKAVSDTGNLIFYKLEGKHSERILKIAYKKKAYVSPAVTAFVNVAKEIYN
jgi:DNA-binding transcriptional LysR family regulator